MCGFRTMTENRPKNTNGFALTGEPDYPPRPIVILSEQGDTALFQLYKPHANTSQFEIARQRSASAKIREKYATRGPEIKKIMKI